MIPIGAKKTNTNRRLRVELSAQLPPQESSEGSEKLLDLVTRGLYELLEKAGAQVEEVDVRVAQHEIHKNGLYKTCREFSCTMSQSDPDFRLEDLTRIRR